MKHGSIFKPTALLLVVLIASFSLFGCSGAGTQTTAAPATSAATSAVSDSSSGQTTAGVVKEHHLTILGKDRRYDCAPFSDRDQYPTWQAVEKLLAENGITCEFELVPKEQYPTAIQARMAAASDLPDIVNLIDLDDQTVLDMGAQGSIIDVKAAIDQYSNGNTLAMWEKYWPDATKLITTPDGKIFWYPSFSNRQLNGKATEGTGFALQYRGDWAKNLGLSAPKTIDDLYTMMKAFRDQDANGNGTADELALVSVDGFLNGIAQSFGLAPNLFDISNKADKAVTPWYQPGIKQYIEFMKKCVAEGLIDASLIGATGEVSDQKITENKGGLVFNYIQQNWLEPMTGLDTADYVPVMPKADGLEPVFEREPSALVYEKYCVTKNCQDVEGAVKLFDTLYTEDYAQLSMWGVEGTSFKWDGDRKVAIYPDYTDEQLAEAKALVGHSLCGHTVFPVVNIQEEWADVLTAQKVSQAKQDYEISMQSFTDDYSTSPALALPTEDERAVADKYATTLNTYSSELLVNLILGNTSIDDLDASIKEMQTMGLDEMLKVYQSRHDRFTATK
ncbi:MAG: hypothetical protein VB070_09220 [Clostridiaceae bacterium]|nr:hypothetical protein [Clostridiaceae bacterium]